MSNLRAQLRSDLAASMKAKDKVRTGTIRMLLSAITQEETQGTSKKELDEAQLVQVVAREIKKRRESAEIYRSNGRDDLAESELAEVSVLEDYQPKQLTDEELSSLIDAVITTVGATSMKDMGQVMKEATAQAAGRADGKRLSTAVRERLQ